MIRFIMPTILIGISVAVFFMFASPIYSQIGDLKTQVDSFNEALDNSKALESAKDTLTQKKNAIDPANLTKLEKLLPESIDNIRLILEIEQVALPYGMTLKDVKYSSTAQVAAANNPVQAAGTTQAAATVQPSANSNKGYGVWDLSFSTTGSYNNFLNFTRDLESNLRIVDVSSIQFSSSIATGTTSGPTSSDSYKYDFKIKTYWLKN